jgi:iron complex outermembrane receptor protein
MSLLAAMVAVPAHAQSGTTVTGRVTLAGGEPVHGATVVIVGARRTATTDDTGAFTIAGVSPGTYEVLAQREHFTAARQTIVIGQTPPTPLAFVLTAETVHEQLTVTASATGAATTFEAFSSVSSLDSLELAENRGATLTDALAGVPGVSIRSFGSGSARPIVRGFDGDRVLVMGTASERAISPVSRPIMASRSIPPRWSASRSSRDPRRCCTAATPSAAWST